MEFYIVPGTEFSNHWTSGSYSYLVTNDDCDYSGTFGLYLTLDDVVDEVAKYFLVAYIGRNTVQAQVGYGHCSHYVTLNA